jgi:hypothetical protein
MGRSKKRTRQHRGPRPLRHVSVVVAAIVSATLLVAAPRAGAINLTNDGQGGGTLGTVAGIGALVAMLFAALLVQRRRDRRRDQHRDVPDATPGDRATEATAPMIAALLEARRLVALPDNDFSWSSWRDAEHALAEIDGYLAQLETGANPAREIGGMFLPTGPMQELSIASGWPDAFGALANAFARADDLSATTPGERPSSAQWHCHACGQRAGIVALDRSATPAEVRRESFTGVLTQPSNVEGTERLHRALVAQDAGAVWALDPELAPFYCPTCGASYCGEHWQRWDVFDDDAPGLRDCIRGRCPQGHERLIED